MAVVAAPGVETAQHVGHAGYALWVFAVPALIAALIEAPIAVWSDHLRRGAVLGFSLLALAIALVLCALAPRAPLLAAGLALAGAASGAACASAQGELVARAGASAGRAMSRWVALAAAGDALVPLVVGAVLWLGGTYRAALLVVAGAVALQATLVLCARSDVAATETPEQDAPESVEPLRAALARPAVWWLLLAAACCTLLDEILAALAALRLTRDLGASDGAAALSLTALSIGSLCGAALTEVLVARASSRVVLVASAGATFVCLALLVAAPTRLAAVGALFALGVCEAPHYALLKAAAYDAVPGRPGLVNAAAQLYVVLEIAAPLLVGLVAARYGLGAALATLSLQPVAVLIAALTVLPRDSPP